jgi:subtilisin family serine protease
VFQRQMLSGYRRLPSESAPAVTRRLPSAAATHDVTKNRGFAPAVGVAPGLKADPLELVNLGPLMRRSSGRAEVVIGLIDGPVQASAAGLEGARIGGVADGRAVDCTLPAGRVCEHGTFVASILMGRRATVAPAICPDCTLLVRPIFVEASPRRGVTATPEDLAAAIVECVEGGARVINVSASLTPSALHGQHRLQAALDAAARSGVLVVVASGNEAVGGSTALTGHPWVLPVVAFGSDRRPLPDANLGRAIGRRGVGAPGQAITALGPDGRPRTYSGSSAAAPFVTGALALCIALLGAVDGVSVRHKLHERPLHAAPPSIVPPLFDAWMTFLRLARRGGSDLPEHQQREMPHAA